MQFNQSVVLIAGAARDIGEAKAKHLAQSGAKLNEGVSIDQIQGGLLHKISTQETQALPPAPRVTTARMSGSLSKSFASAVGSKDAR